MKTASLMLGVLILFFAAFAAAQPAPTRVLTNDGSVVNGTITGGALVLRTTFGADLHVDPRRVQSLIGNALTLDDGSVIRGTLGSGQLQFTSAFGTLTIPVDRLTEIQNVKAQTPTTPPPTGQTPPAPTATAKVTTTTPKAVSAPPKVQFVNETRRTLSVCVNDETPCLQIGPNASLTRTYQTNALRLRVESTTTLGPLIIATGSFERSVQVEQDTVVRVTEGDFR